MADVSEPTDAQFHRSSDPSAFENALGASISKTDQSFGLILRFLSDNPELAPKTQKVETDFHSETYQYWLKEKFIRGREVKSISTSTTVSDPVVENIMSLYFSITEEQIPEAIQWHRQAMAAENILGTLLEAYIAEALESHGWVWCSGSTVKSVDFIRPHHDSWIGLQIKNRDNSENSSSASVREGTSIEKWHRLSSRSGKTHWDWLNNLIASDFCGLSEIEFQKFALEYIGGG